MSVQAIQIGPGKTMWARGNELIAVAYTFSKDGYAVHRQDFKRCTIRDIEILSLAVAVFDREVHVFTDDGIYVVTLVNDPSFMAISKLS